MGKSGHIARKIASTLASTGTPALFVHPSEASHGDLGMVGKSDVIVALSWSGETVELKNLVDFSRRFRIGLIAVTGNSDSTLGRAADIVLALPAGAGGLSAQSGPTTSSVIQLALGDALAIALLESRGFTALDFRDLHPGGRLGAVLRFVRDIMHTGAAIPLAPEGTPISTAIVDISAGGFGCIGMVGRRRPSDRHHHRRRPAPAHGPGPAGAARRRHHDAQAEHGSCGPIASEVLEHLNSTKITAVFVVEDGRPVGIVHMHDLLRAGIA